MNDRSPTFDWPAVAAWVILLVIGPAYLFAEWAASADGIAYNVTLESSRVYAAVRERGRIQPTSLLFLVPAAALTLAFSAVRSCEFRVACLIVAVLMPCGTAHPLVLFAPLCIFGVPSAARWSEGILALALAGWWVYLWLLVVLPLERRRCRRREHPPEGGFPVVRPPSKPGEPADSARRPPGGDSRK